MSILNIIDRKSILFVGSDNAYISELTLMIKEEGFTYFYATDMLQARKVIQSEQPDMAFITWEFHQQMEDFKGLCRAPYTTLILIAKADASSQEIYETLTLGGDDYVKEPLDQYKLKSKVHLGIRLTKATRYMNHDQELNGNETELLSSKGIAESDLHGF